MRALWLWGFTASVLVIGCIPEVPEPCGVLVWADDNSASRTLSLDFGGIFECVPATRELQLRNVGSCAVQLASIERVSGPEIFEVAAELGPIEPGQSIPVKVTARNGPNGMEAPEAEFLACGSGAGCASLVVKSHPVTGDYFAPGDFDFGVVAVGDVVEQRVTLRNPTQFPATYTIGTPSSASHPDAFSLSPGIATGELIIPPGEEREIAVRFYPTEEGEHLGFMKLGMPPCGYELNLRLSGTAVGAVMTWSPERGNFGYVMPGTEKVLTITFTNAQAKAIALTGLKTLNFAEFRIVSPASGALEVPAATRDASGEWIPGTASIQVGFKPLQPGHRSTQLTFRTDHPKQPDGLVTLSGFGGGADIYLPSSVVEFGQVGATQTRKLTVLNVGTLPPAPDLAANLHIELLEVVSSNPGTAADEFEVQLPPTYDPVWGLEGRSGRNAVDLFVTVNPKSAGIKEAELRIHSNDPDEPIVTVTLRAEVLALPPCQFSLDSSPFDFGAVPQGWSRTRALKFTNVGVQSGDLCLLTVGEVSSADPSRPFALVNGAASTVLLPPGESFEIPVRFESLSASFGAASGTLELFVSSPTQPRVLVPLVATSGPSCLEIAPGILDFGTAKLACVGTTKSARLYNTCSTPIRILSATVSSAAGQPAGGPNCSGAQPCPEFTLTSNPIQPGGTVIAPAEAPVVLELEYSPIDAGADLGELVVEVDQGHSATYRLSLAGLADATGNVTETFRVPTRKKQDVLFVLDNSEDWGQVALANAIPDFLKGPQASRMDLQIAVTTTDMDATGEQGRFVFGATHPDRVLGANSAAQLAAKVQVGAAGSANEMCFEAALRALTPPLSLGHNAGLLRPDASLAVICVLAEADHSPAAPASYLDQFWNIKGHGRKSAFTFSAMNGFSAGCPYDSGTLRSVVDATGGARDDLCNPNWSGFLANVLGNDGETQKFFDLTSQPDSAQGIASVKINGVLIPPTSLGVPVWTWDSASNRIAFTPVYAPEGGQTVEISYPVACGP